MVGNEWIVIPAGEFVMGTSPEEAGRLAKQYGHHPSWLSGEQPRRVVYVPAFAIQKYPVTNREYAEFCKSTGYAPPLHWRGNAPPADLLDHPVTFVSQEGCGGVCEVAWRAFAHRSRMGEGGSRHRQASLSMGQPL